MSERWFVFGRGKCWSTLGSCSQNGQLPEHTRRRTIILYGLRALHFHIKDCTSVSRDTHGLSYSEHYSMFSGGMLFLSLPPSLFSPFFFPFLLPGHPALGCHEIVIKVPCGDSCKGEFRPGKMPLLGMRRSNCYPCRLSATNYNRSPDNACISSQRLSLPPIVVTLCLIV